MMARSMMVPPKIKSQQHQLFIRRTRSRIAGNECLFTLIDTDEDPFEERLMR